MHLSPSGLFRLLSILRHCSVVVYCLMCFPLFVGVLCLSLFCYGLLCVHSGFAIILKTK